MSMSVAFSLGDQGAGVRSLLSQGWFVWSFNMKGINVYTAESVWRAQMEESTKLFNELEALKADSTKKLDAVRGLRMLQLYGNTFLTIFNQDTIRKTKFIERPPGLSIILLHGCPPGEEEGT